MPLFQDKTIFTCFALTEQSGGTGADNQHARSVGHTLISPSAVDSGLLSYTS